jgi:glycosyltransferase involved in cell wall biosynthesis
MLSRVVKDAARRFADGYMLAHDAEAISGVPVEFLPSTRQSTNSSVQPPRAQPPYRFLFLGRWHPNKGVDLLLDALALLKDQDWDCISRFEIQGGGPLESQVRTGVAALRNAGRPVVHGGYLAKMEAEAAIARSDWLVIPSRIESIPVVFSDAVKLDRPVIATPAGDLQRLLGEFACGICCSSVDANSIADGIRSALCSRASSYEPGIRRAAAQFSLPDIAQRMLQVGVPQS